MDVFAMRHQLDHWSSEYVVTRLLDKEASILHTAESAILPPSQGGAAVDFWIITQSRFIWFQHFKSNLNFSVLYDLDFKFNLDIEITDGEIVNMRVNTREAGNMLIEMELSKLIAKRNISWEELDSGNLVRLKVHMTDLVDGSVNCVVVWVQGTINLVNNK